jgi:hypothetical protein
MTFGIVDTYVEQMGTSLTRAGSAGRPVCPSCGVCSRGVLQFGEAGASA